MANARPALDEAEEMGAIDDVLVIRPRRMRTPETDIDITPMIDITFLLLIFFLVASIARQSPVELPEARYGEAVATDEAAVITIDTEGVDGAVIYKGDGAQDEARLTNDALVAQEAELVEYIQSVFDTHPRKRHVMIKAAKDVKHRHVARVSHAAGRALRGGRLYVAVLEAE